MVFGRHGVSRRRGRGAATSADDVSGTALRRRVSRPRDSDAGARKRDVIGDVTSGLRRPAGTLRVRRLHRLRAARPGL